MLTPTAFSQFLAGIGLWSVIWSAVLKIEYIAKFLRLGRWVSRDRILDWISENKVITLLGTEAINFGTHDLESASSVTFALGGTLLNVFVIFFFLPVRKQARKMWHFFAA